MHSKDKTQLKVSALRNGTVIDHIPAQNLFKVISILKLEKIKTQITFGTNLESKQLGSKAIIKISDVFFQQEEISKIALVAPEAKLNIIKEYEVVEKKLLVAPDEVKGIARCFNPKCITNNEAITTRFEVLTKKPVSLKCHYCEKIMHAEHLVLI
ncbi:MAG TPA: aspartate carbamoyltransferase regulatory subunit [Bacteroidales bacterium]|nr:aspartate carbamoyltransferase regulatory subunit [Bacteroidales bacterium]